MNNWQKAEGDREGEGEIWNPDKGDQIQGFLKDVEHDVGQYNSTMYFIETEDGLMKVWGCAVLDTRMKNVKMEHEVNITYQGRKKSQKTGRPYKSYEVFHRPPLGKTRQAQDGPPPLTDDDI